MQLQLPAGCGTRTNFTAATTDGSGYTMIAQSVPNQNYYTATIYDKSGKVVSQPLSGNQQILVQDPDGATIASNASAPYNYTDSLGVTALQYIPNSDGSVGKFQYTDGAGSTQTFQINYSAYTEQTTFGCANIQDIAPTPVTLPSSISTPTGTIALSYEPTPGNTSNTTGRLASVAYPAGGSVSFAYGGANHGINCSSGVVPTLTRTLNDNNGNVSTWTYVNSKGTTSNFTVTETDPANNQTVHSFAGEYQTQAKYYQGSATGTPLKTVLTCYNGNTSNCASPGTQPVLPITETDVYTSLNTSANSRRVTTFDVAYGNVLSILSYDFGGTLLSQTYIVYGQSYSSPTACTAYSSGTYIYSTPCYIHTQNASGTELAETKVTYSNTGHPTSISKWTGATENTWLTTTLGYGANGASPGVLSSLTEPNGAVTTFNSFNCSGMFPAGTTYSLTSVGSDSQVWDCSGGVKTSYTDVNGKATSYSYNDLLWRLTSVVRPSGGGSTTTAYSNGTSLPWTVTATTTTDASDNVAVTDFLDGLGRTYAVYTSDPQSSNV